MLISLLEIAAAGLAGTWLGVEAAARPPGTGLLGVDPATLAGR